MENSKSLFDAASDLDAVLTTFQEEHPHAGVAVGAVVGTEVVCMKAAGSSGDQAVSAQSTAFLTASISKTFLAAVSCFLL